MEPQQNVSASQTVADDCDISIDESPDLSWKNVPHGRPKSGRLWRDPKPTSLSKISKSQPTLRTSWQKKVEERAKTRSVKDYERNLKDEKKRKLEEKRLRNEQRKKLKLEKQRRAEIVQPITNTAKIKRMKKKQLRYIEKR
jgi:rRNA-processing protein CGR1